MNILWQNSFLAPLLALAAVPLLLHLFARTKPKSYLFSSNMFLRSCAKQNARIKRPFDILLLILRTLLFLAIIFMFMKPLLFLFPDSGGIFEKKTVIIIIDASASMGLQEDGRTRFAAACTEGSEILSGLSSGDKADVIWLQTAPAAEFPEPGSNFIYMQQQLRRRKVTSEAGNAEAAVKLAVDMLKDRPGRREICIISDFQASQWKDRKLAIPERIKVATIQIGKSNPGNLAIDRVDLNPSTLLQGETAYVSCVVRNYSSEPRSCTVFFSGSESRQNRNVMIPANGSASPLFTLQLNKPGPLPLEFSISEDAFPEDNTINTIAIVKEAMKVGIVSGAKYPAEFWKRSLSALPWAKLELLKLDDPRSWNEPDVLLLSGWNGQNIPEIKKFIESGKTVICSPAPNCPATALASLTGQKAGKPDEKVFLEQGGKPFNLKVLRDKDRILEIFANGEFGDPAGGEFKARLNYGKPGAETVFAWQDGLPALTRISDRGALYIWGMVLDPQYSNWAYRVQFLPFMAEIIQKTGAAVPNQYPANAPGSRLKMRLTSGIAVDKVTLQTSGVKLSPTVQYLDKTPYLVSPPIEACGLYRWIYNGETAEYNVVNFPAVESNLAQLPPGERKQFGLEMSGGRKLSELDTGVDIWPYLLAAAMLFAVLEGLVMWWSRRSG